MTSARSESHQPRSPLTREQVLRAAVDLADRRGIEQLSMRNLGQALGTDAMVLYRHVANKENLLDGMIDLVFGEISPPPSGVEWKAAIRQRAVATRDVLTRHAWAVGLMESRSRPGPATLYHHDAVLGCLRNAGFSIQGAAHAYSVLDSYIYGFVLNEQSLPHETPDEVIEIGGRMLREFPSNMYPYLAEFISEHAMKPGYNYGNEFEFGLDLILDGLERVRDGT